MCRKGLRSISYQFTPTFFTSHKPSKTDETRMHNTMCYVQIILFALILFCLFSQI